MAEKPSSQELLLLQQSLFDRCEDYLAQDGLPTRRVTEQGDIFEGITAQRTILLQMPWRDERVVTGTFTIAREVYLGRDQTQPKGVTVLDKLHSANKLGVLGQEHVSLGTLDTIRRRIGAAMPTIEQSAIIIEGYLDWLLNPEIFVPHKEEFEDEDYAEDYAWRRDLDFGEEGYVEVRRDLAKMKGAKYVGQRGGWISHTRDLTAQEVQNVLAALDTSEISPVTSTPG